MKRNSRAMNEWIGAKRPVQRAVVWSDPVEVTEVTEEYVETIYNMAMEGDIVIGARLAEKFRVAPPTVTETLKRMLRDGLVAMDARPPVTLTERACPLARGCGPPSRSLREPTTAQSCSTSAATRCACRHASPIRCGSCPAVKTPAHERCQGGPHLPWSTRITGYQATAGAAARGGWRPCCPRGGADRPRAPTVDLRAARRRGFVTPGVQGTHPHT